MGRVINALLLLALGAVSGVAALARGDEATGGGATGSSSAVTSAPALAAAAASTVPIETVRELVVTPKFGVVDETLTIPAGESATTVSVGAAHGGGPSERPLELRLAPIEASGSASEVFARARATLEVGPADAGRAFRVVGLGFHQPLTFRAHLSVGKDRAHLIVIRPERVPTGLGLAATEWNQVVTVLPIAFDNSVKTCIKTTLVATSPLRYVLGPPKQPRAGSMRVVPQDVTIATVDDANCRGLRIEMSNLGPGQYDGQLDIEGEVLSFQLSLRPPSITLFLSILLGAVLSVAIRQTASHLAQRAENEAGISELEGQPPQWTLVWDGIKFGNAMRRARGYNRRLGMDSVKRWLVAARQAAPRRPELDRIVAALETAPLPSGMRGNVRLELAHVLRLSSPGEMEEVERGLTALTQAADEGFRGRFENWLLAQHDLFDAAAVRLTAKLTAARLAPELEQLARAVLQLLGQLLLDAEEILRSSGPNRIGLSPDHVIVLERIVPFTATFSTWIDHGLQQHRAQLVDAWFCQLPDASQPPPALQLPEACRIVPSPMQIVALAEQTFEVEGVPRDMVPHLKFLWSLTRLDRRNQPVGQPEMVSGGPRLTWVFSECDSRFGRGRKAVGRIVSVEIAAATPGEALTPEASKKLYWPPQANERFRVGPEISRLKDMRASAWLVKQGALVFGSALVGAAAAFYWMDKPFGDLTDYMTLLLAGVGVDAGTSNANLKELFGKLKPKPAEAANKKPGEEA